MKTKATWIGLIGALSPALMAADYSNFPPTTTFGFVAPVETSAFSVDDGNTKLFRTWFDNNDNSGDLLAHSIDSAGAIAGSSSWSAKTQLDATTYSDRKIALGSADYDCATSADTLVRFICGDTTNEGSTYRDREAVLGDIIHSNPVHVGAPDWGFNFSGYQAFASTNKNRTKTAYVGANDGMLHAFDAATGNEIFAYIPSMVSGNLSALGTDPYTHQYFVDGPLASFDAYANFDGSPGNEWRTILVGGLGAGGVGYFGLNVTDPTTASGAAAASKVLWEFTDVNMGYTYGKPLVVRTNSNSGEWSLIAPNGYKNTGDGTAHLYIRKVEDPGVTPGNVIKDFELDSSVINNGLSAPAAIDTDGDEIVDVIYAGDLNGNLWRFYVKSSNTALWTATRLFTAKDASNDAQPIIAAPDLYLQEDGTVVVFFGTGDPFDFSPNADQSFYAVKDADPSANVASAYTRSDLQVQLLNDLTVSGTPYKIQTSTNSIATSKKGWYVDLGADEHITQSPILNDSRIQFMVHELTNGSNWWVQLAYATGGVPSSAIYDLNDDNALSDEDNPNYVDSNDTGDIVLGVQQTADLVSGPVLAHSGSLVSVYWNTWNEGTAGSVLPTPSCTKLHFDRFDLPSSTDRPTHYDVTFTAHPTNDAADDIWVKATNLDDDGNYDPITPAAGSANRGAGSGVTVNGNESWAGLSMFLGEVRDDRFWMQIEYQGPYQIDDWDIVFDNFSVRRIHNGINVCSCTGNYSSSCETTSEAGRIIYSDDSDGGVSFIDNSSVQVTLNATNLELNSGVDQSVVGAGSAAVAAVGQATTEKQKANNKLLGRIRWRELLF